MIKKILLSIIILAPFIILANRARADEKSAVYFWISEEGMNDFPWPLIEKKDIKPGAKAAEAVQCGKDVMAGGAGGKKYENDLNKAIELFFTNKFDNSGSILDEIWKKLKDEEESAAFRLQLMTKCFVYRMMIFKASGKTDEAQQYAKDASEYVSMAAISGMEISPDSLEFIAAMLDRASQNEYSLDVSLSPADKDCSVFVDGVELPQFVEKLRFQGGIHWISSACGDISGWKWKIEFPAFDGKLLELNPETESQCDCSGLPVVACSIMDESILKIASNLLVHGVFNGFYLLRPSAKDGDRGVETSRLIKKTDAGLTGLEWSWKALPGQPLAAVQSSPKKGRKKKIALPTLVMALSGAAMAGLSVGFAGWAIKFKNKCYTIQDPWQRKEAENKYHNVKNASIALSAVAVSFLITSVIYHTVSYKKHKEKKDKTR